MKDTPRLLPFRLGMLPTLWQSLTHLRTVEGYAHASNLVNKGRNWYALPTIDKRKPENQDQTPV
jgi:hypothetical protein